MAEAQKCAHPSCACTVTKGSAYGKYCSEHCKEKRDTIELRCDCQHTQCREG